MAHESEAVCLLRTGAIFPKRLGLRSLAGENVLLGSRVGAFSIYFDDQPFYHFDPEGRWQRAFIDHVHYLKGLDGTVHSIDRVREGANMVLKRRSLSFSEVSDLDASVRSVALSLRERIDTGYYDPIPPPDGDKTLSRAEADREIDGIALWDASAWFSHRERYVSTYGVLPFLPPDCPNALTLQATLGHKHGRAFGLARPEPYYERTIDEFASHVQDVKRLVGRRVDQSKHLFVAGADVLSLDPETILGFFRTLQDPGLPATRMTFLDDVPERPWEISFLKELAELGLTRVAFGIESGDADTRSRFGKSWSEPSAVAAIGAMKAAGIDISVMLLIGSGGVENAEADVEASPSLVERLPLGAGDFVYLVDVREQLNPEAAGSAFRPCGTEESERRSKLVKKRLEALRARSGVKVAPYTFAKQWS